MRRMWHSDESGALGQGAVMLHFQNKIDKHREPYTQGRAVCCTEVVQACYSLNLCFHFLQDGNHSPVLSFSMFAAKYAKDNACLRTKLHGTRFSYGFLIA
jgi:hypothetical protein